MIINPLTGKVEQEEITQPTGPDLTSVRSPTEQPYVEASNYGNRLDGTPKGAGFFGELQRPDGNISTELSIGLNIDGKETEVPSLIPTLTEEEKQYLLNGGKPTPEIAQKAAMHAKERMAKGLSPFKEDGEDKKPISNTMIIDPFSGEVASGREKKSEMNPLAEGPVEKGTPEYNYLYGALDVAQGTVELARDATWGAVSWPLAQVVRHGAVAREKIRQVQDALYEKVTGQKGSLAKNLTPEQQAAMGENVANYIQTMGGLATPKSVSGKQSLEAVGKVIEPIQKIAHWTAQGVNPEKYPNLHNAIATGVEFGLFATVPKVKSGLTKIKKMRETSLELKGKEKAAADLAILKEQDALMKKMNADLESTSMNEMKALVNERMEKNQQLVQGAEGFSAIDIAKPEAPKIIDPITGQETVSLAGSKSELSQRGQGSGDAPIRPNLGRDSDFNLSEAAKNKELLAEKAKIESLKEDARLEGIKNPQRLEGSKVDLTQKEITGESPPIKQPNLGKDTVNQTPERPGVLPKGKTTVEKVTDQNLPKTEYQINPETGKPEPIYKAGERKAYQIGESGVKLVESVPGEKSVWQIITEPLKNESGAVDLSFLDRRGKKWLKGSKVTDGKGNPQPMFHVANDTAVLAAGFDPKKSPEIGIHFGTEKQIEGMSTDVNFKNRKVGIPVILNIKNPIRLRDGGSFSPNSVVNQLVGKKLIPGLSEGSPKFKKLTGQISAVRKKNKNSNINVGPKITFEQNKIIREFLQDEGYDGIVYRNRGERVLTPKELKNSQETTTQDSFIAFKAEQVKSVFDKDLWKDKRNNPEVNLTKHNESKEVSKAPTDIALEINKTIPGTELKYDGAFDRTVIKKPPLHQFTPQEGPLKGRTFGIEEVSVEAVQKKMNEMTGKTSLFKTLLDPLKNERGSVDLTELSKAFGKAPKAASLLNQLIKKGISKQDLLLSGLGSHLSELNQKKVDWKEFKKIADEGGFDVTKESMGKKPKPLSPEEVIELNGYKDTARQMGSNNLNSAFTNSSSAGRRAKELYKRERGVSDNPEIYGPEQSPEYNLPGHKEGSYKENLYKYEPQDINIPDWQEPHWGKDGANVMAHSRQHDRIVGSKDVVYVDELQSNWHRDGDKTGYGTKAEQKQRLATQLKAGKITKEAYNKARGKLMGGEDGVPDAPFKKTWPQMIMRDVISDAIARNKDGVAWSTGRIQAERWGGKAQTKRDAIYDKTVVKFFKNELGVTPRKVKTITGQLKGEKLEEIANSIRQLEENIAKLKEEVPQRPDIIMGNEEALASRMKDFDNVLSSKDKAKSDAVWYVPITGKMRRLFGDGKIMDAIDNMFMPLRNERGAIRIPTRRKAVETKVSESQRKQIRKYGMMAEKANKTFKEFLSETGLTPKEIHAMEKLHKFVKEENPIASKLEPVKRSKSDMTPFSLKEGEKQVNITKGNGNKKIMIGESDATAIFSSSPGRKGLGSWFKPAEFMFDRYPKLRNLLDQAREVQSTIKNELEISSKHVDALQKEFSNKKLREEVGAYWHSFSILGKDAMKQMGVEVNANPKYKELKTKLEPKFKDLFTRINTQRVKLGKRPIKKTGDYLSFFAKESLWTDFKNLVKGEEAKGGYSNLVLDDLATIKQRQAGAVKDSPAFAHLKRAGLRKGVKLELDPLVIYSRYLNDSLRHIHMSPINAFVKELLTAELTDFKTGKTAIFSKERPNVAAELASWNNKIAGLDNMEVPRVFQKLLNKGMNNLTVAQLFGNLRTSFIQSTALFPTAVKFGYASTTKGIAQISIGKGNAPFSKSSSLNTAAWDAAVADMGNAIAGTKYQKGKLKVVEGSAWLMKSIDYFARKATFQTVWNSLEPLVKKGKMTQKEAIRIADAEINRTQGSGDAVELAPIQRNVLGKMATQWQTFTINHMNFVAKDVLGIKNPELKPAETAVRVLRYVAGGLAINALFEQGLGIQSPMPAPIQGIIRGLEAGDSFAAILLGTMMEVGEAFPGGGSIKFGSNPLGPLVKQSDDIVKALSGTTAFNKDMITKAMMGDERSMIALADILGKTLGVPGTAQGTKFARGQRRGESVPRSLAGRIYTEPKKAGGLSSKLKKNKRSRLKSSLK